MVENTNEQDGPKPESNDPARNPERPHAHLMNPKEAALYLGFHLVTLYRLLKKREIPATKIGGQWRFKKDILDAWLFSKMNGAE